MSVRPTPCSFRSGVLTRRSVPGAGPWALALVTGPRSARSTRAVAWPWSHDLPLDVRRGRRSCRLRASRAAGPATSATVSGGSCNHRSQGGGGGGHRSRRSGWRPTRLEARCATRADAAPRRSVAEWSEHAVRREVVARRAARVRRGGTTPPWRGSRSQNCGTSEPRNLGTSGLRELRPLRGRYAAATRRRPPRAARGRAPRVRATTRSAPGTRRTGPAASARRRRGAHRSSRSRAAPDRR